MQHDVHAPPSPFFNGPKVKFFAFGLPWLGFDLQENIDTFFESIKVNPFMNPQQDVWYVLAYVVMWIVLHVVWQQLVAQLYLVVRPRVLKKREAAAAAAAGAKAERDARSNGSKDDGQLRHRKPANGAPAAAAKAADAAADALAADKKKKAQAADDAEEMQKFLTAGWKSFVYALLFVVGMLIWTSHPWWNDRTQWWYAWPHYMEDDVRQFFCAYLAFYITETGFLFYEPKMKDRPIMFTHHAATMLLILTSYCQGHYRIALPVMVLHDFSDPFMEVAKMFHYVDARALGVPLADVFFIMFAIAFFVTRLGFFPFYVIWSVMFEATIVCTYCNGLYIWLVFFFTLLTLHVFWSYLIVQMIFVAIVHKGVQGDIRE
eukprot:Unigene7299_Nuclearia_a/m.22417 Unigene7299_Nuclearia_a/g.22417  ORF Unigene7299_Nuclearia_a/g.22417 Unigene7299_Nuclearia_a/m.22417 type:complete len:375 (-) Unigene7299_Nuclearia_a:53-1177(-)